MSQKTRVALSIGAIGAVAAAASLASLTSRLPDGFHAFEGVTQKEIDAGDVREFVGDGTPYLKVPGLKTVLGVRVGIQDIPLEIEQDFPTDVSLKRVESVTTPLIHLATSPEGEPFLLRAKQSNDGIWQAGHSIFVKGEWEDEPEAGAAEAAADDPAKSGNEAE